MSKHDDLVRRFAELREMNAAVIHDVEALSAGLSSLDRAGRITRLPFPYTLATSDYGTRYGKPRHEPKLPRKMKKRLSTMTITVAADTYEARDFWRR